MVYDVCNGSGSGSATLQLTVGSGSAGSPQGSSSGDLVVVCANSATSFGITNVTDTQSNTYTAAVSDATTGDQGAIWSSKTTAALVAGTDKITVTFGGSAQHNVIVKGVAGVSSGTVDQTAHAGASSSSPSSGATGPLSQANEFVVGMIGNASTGGIPTGLPWGGTGTTIHSGSGPYLTVFTESVSATAALTAGGTLTASANWCCLAATWKLTSTGALTITSTSPPSDSVGDDYNAGTGYTLTATGGSGSGYTWSVKSGNLPPGLSLAGGTSGGHICGSSIAKVGTTSAEVAYYNTWNGKVSAGGLGLYTAVSRKIYFTSSSGPSTPGNFPTNATVALWKANNPDVGACLTLGMGMYLCYRPIATGTYNDPGWPGGAVMASPTQIATDYANMKASIQSLQSACTSAANGASVLGVIIWQENDNKSGFPGAQSSGGTSYNAYVASHNYYAYYPLLKADFPHLDVLISYVNYPHGTASQDATDRMQRFPGPHPLNPSGWGTATVNGNSTNLFCDGITTDEYADGAYAYTGTYPNGTIGTNPTGRLRYMYAEPDLYTPPASGGAAGSGNPGWCDVADYNGIGWGNLETGNNASTGNPNLTQMQAYLAGIPLSNPQPIGNDTMVHSMLQVYQTRVANNAPLIGMLWYENPGNTTSGYNNITSSSDKRIPWLNAIDAATAQSTSSVVGGTLTDDSANVTYPHTYSVVFKVKDSAGTAATATLGFTVTAASVTLKVSTTSLQSGTAGQSYSQTLQTNGGGTGTGYTWTLNAGSLSGSGLSLSSAGVISGSNPVQGTYSGLQFKVTDSGSNTALSATGMSITIAAASVTVTITSTSPLPNGTTGSVYATTLTASGGTAPYTYALAATSPALPPGLVLDSTDPLEDQAGNPLTDQFGVNLEDQTGVP